MLSIRSFARAAPRTVSRLSASAFRRPSARPVSLLQSAWRPARTQYAAAFSTSTIRPAKSGESDDELVAKLESEIQMETEMADDGAYPTSVKEFLENGPFTLIDTEGQEEVVLTRKFGDENIKITFSIADINSIDPEADYSDRAIADEEDDNINQGDEKNFKVAPEDQIEEDQEGEGEEGEEDQESSFPARLNIVIEKPARGAIAVEAVVQEGMVVIENVFYYTDASFAYGKTADKVHERQDLYVGPPFSNLDEDLQVHLERYLDERGINAALALFVPDYIDLKEQKEYLRWLENVKSFVEA